MIMRLIQGSCMALADSVPGVSGGTVAFLLGFYDKFIGSINDLIRGNKEQRIEAIKFLIKIGIGWIIGLCMAILFITSVFEEHIYAISSLFIGFIPIIVSEEKECLKKNYFGMSFILVGAALVGGITAFSGSTILSDGVNLAAGKFDVKVGILLFLAGMIAISAMVLPGISGSTILMIFGLYIPITNAIKDILHLKLEYVQQMLEKFRPQTVYFIIGMMIGSLYSIIMGPTTLKDESGVNLGNSRLTWNKFSILFFVIGGIVIFGLQFMKYILEKKNGKGLSN